MKTDFTRTIVTSTIKVAEITVVNGQVTTNPLADVVQVGTKELSEDSALKIAKKEYNGKNVVVLEIENKEEVRGMDFKTFMAHSVKVDRPASQQK